MRKPTKPSDPQRETAPKEIYSCYDLSGLFLSDLVEEVKKLGYDQSKLYFSDSETYEDISLCISVNKYTDEELKKKKEEHKVKLAAYKEKLKRYENWLKEELSRVSST